MRFGALIILAAAVAALFLLRDVQRPKKTAKHPGASMTLPEQALPGTDWRQVRVLGRDHGKPSWEFHARQVLEAIGGLVIDAYEISEGLIYDKTGVSCTFKAGSLRLEVLTRQVYIKDGFSGKLSDETTFMAAEAVADLRQQTLTIPVPVKVEGKEINISADGLTADLTAEIITLTGNVVVQWSGGTVHAGQVTYSVKDRSFSIEGGEGGGVDLTL